MGRITVAMLMEAQANFNKRMAQRELNKKRAFKILPSAYKQEKGVDDYASFRKEEKKQIGLKSRKEKTRGQTR